MTSQSKMQRKSITLCN